MEVNRRMKTETTLEAIKKIAFGTVLKTIEVGTEGLISPKTNEELNSEEETIKSIIDKRITRFVNEVQ